MRVNERLVARALGAEWRPTRPGKELQALRVRSHIADQPAASTRARRVALPGRRRRAPPGVREAGLQAWLLWLRHVASSLTSDGFVIFDRGADQLVELLEPFSGSGKLGPGSLAAAADIPAG
jgi:hypothetical protein